MAQVNGVFEDTLQKNVTDSKVLMVGAGGIGCELLKNLVLSGSKTIGFCFDPVKFSSYRIQRHHHHRFGHY